jgi:hypothetical protein
MSANELKEIKKESKKFIDNADERAIRMVYALLEADQKSDLSPQQEAILEERMRKYEKGLMKFSTWEDARTRIISK